MKKTFLQIFLILILLSNVPNGFSQNFFETTNYRGAFEPAPVAMWTDSWSNWDPQSTVYPAPTVTVSSVITTNTTWTSSNVYLIQGQIYVKNGAVLTIQAGTVIMGDKNTPGSGLFITQGSRVEAQGTATQPIIFTSNQAPNSRAAGDWGGIILLGRAANNLPGGIGNIEGIFPSPDTQFGGGLTPDNNDNSGTLSYVRIEFPGYIYQTDKEINGLTLGSVGKGTNLNHIQVSFCNDDSFEFFGGIVNAHHLVAYRGLDDDFDTDNGYSGNIQFALGVKDPAIADNPSISTSEGIESDNDASGSATTPKTSGTFSNFTLIGPYRGNTAASIATGHRRGSRLRRNTDMRVFNSIIMDFPRGIHIDNVPAETNATNGTLKYVNNLVAGTTTNRICEKNLGSTFNIWAWFGANQNDSLASTSGILTSPYNYLTPDYRPLGALALEPGNFTDPVIAANAVQIPTILDDEIEYCQGNSATILSASATAGNTLNWYGSFVGGVPSTVAPVPSTLNAGTTTFFVSQQNVAGFEGPRDSIVIVVNPTPATPVITASGSTSFCTGGSVNLVGPTGFSNVWSGSALTTSTIAVGASGTYFLSISDANGCSAVSNSIVVNVSSAPLPTVSNSGSNSICNGDSVVLTSSLSDTYLWSNGAETQSIVVETSGTYTVTVTNADACAGTGTSSNVVISVNPVPVISLVAYSVAGNVVTFNQTSTGGTSTSWDFGDQSSSSAANPIHAYPGSQSYDVTLTVSNSNCSIDSTFTVDITVGIEESSLHNQLSIYPNPANHIINVIADESIDEVTILDLSGKVIWNQSVSFTETIVETDALISGVYFVSVLFENGDRVVEKIAIRK